ncbi:hypothetical protein RUND412_005397 [Rhizina undulata]
MYRCCLFSLLVAFFSLVSRCNVVPTPSQLLTRDADGNDEDGFDAGTHAGTLLESRRAFRNDADNSPTAMTALIIVLAIFIPLTILGLYLLVRQHRHHSTAAIAAKSGGASQNSKIIPLTLVSQHGSLKDRAGSARPRRHERTASRQTNASADLELSVPLPIFTQFRGNASALIAETNTVGAGRGGTNTAPLTPLSAPPRDAFLESGPEHVEDVSGGGNSGESKSWFERWRSSKQQKP